MITLPVLPSWLTKERLIYGSTIIVLSGTLIFAFGKKPTEVIKTVVQTKTQIVYIDRVIDNNIVTTRYITKNKDGSETTKEVIEDKSKSEAKSSSKTDTKVISEEVTKYQKDWLLSASYPITFSMFQSYPPTFDYTQVQMSLGRRVLDLPLFVTVGTTGKFDSVLVGFTLEL